jgi:hypothetical protein
MMLFPMISERKYPRALRVLVVAAVALSCTQPRSEPPAAESPDAPAATQPDPGSATGGAGTVAGGGGGAGGSAGSPGRGGQTGTRDAAVDMTPAVLTCKPGQHVCGPAGQQQCFADNDKTHCGASCVSCREPANGSAVCMNGACTVTCVGGYHACDAPAGQECKDSTDVRSCGTSCDPCPTRDYAEAICRNQTCDFSCSDGAVACLGSNGDRLACTPTRWDFESDKNDDDWQAALGNGVAGVENSIANGMGVGGGRARKVTVRVDSGDFQVIAVGGLCGGTVDLRSRTFSVQILVEGAPAGSTHMCGLGGFAIGSEPIGPKDREIPVPSGQWTQISYRFDDPRAVAMERLHIDCYMAATKSWTGAVYLDDIRLE